MKLRDSQWGFRWSAFFFFKVELVNFAIWWHIDQKMISYGKDMKRSFLIGKDDSWLESSPLLWPFSFLWVWIPMSSQASWLADLLERSLRLDQFCGESHGAAVWIEGNPSKIFKNYGIYFISISILAVFSGKFLVQNSFQSAQLLLMAEILPVEVGSLSHYL